MTDSPISAATKDRPPFDPSERIAEELSLALPRVQAVVKLLKEGASVPFIARYRKEQTGAADEVVIRAIEEQRNYLVEIDERKETILKEIESQGKLTQELRAQLASCWVKSVLEDIYLPYKPKRRTRAMIARERGLEPLADRILAQPSAGDPNVEAASFVDAEKGVPDIKVALAGARDIVAEQAAENADVRSFVREVFRREGILACEAVPAMTQAPTKFEMYYAFREKIAAIPSHRFLAIRRGESEGVLRAAIEVEKEPALARASAIFRHSPRSPFAESLRLAIDDALSRLLFPSIESEVRVDLKLSSDRDAVGIFAENLRKLLLAPPLGRRVVLGIDPGQRTGCKCVVVDDTGKLVDHTLINLVQGAAAMTHAKKTIIQILEKHHPYAIAVGNGTHGRETADFCRDLLKELGRTGEAMIVLVSESGASVYSASDVARDEFPDLDLTVRGAVSIARRLQDPLAELVKIDPKAIGVGQYQHDVYQPLLKKKLDEVVESCVNAVGVELNTASAPLLGRVAGLGPSLAKKIVKHREEHGAFRSRQDLFGVSGFGDKSFEQCAGFVRLVGAAHPLDTSAVHPERYALVQRIADDAGVKLGDLIGNADIVARIPWEKYVSSEVGLPTLEDIRKELVKPGRDPRDRFEPTQFRDDVRKLEDLAPGMVLEGVVTNVTAFGAFVDVGVHQDGLVHVSQLADRFVKDPHEVAKVGDKLTVRVVEVDLVRKRIALSARKDAPTATTTQPKRGSATASSPAARDKKGQTGAPGTPKAGAAFSNNPFATLLKKE
ncbi:MAG TPA: Tex family protein [Polyangiaceae bacterium]|nr:Tex family protein [Polyangiaceae bacterium]